MMCNLNQGVVIPSNSDKPKLKKTAQNLQSLLLTAENNGSESHKLR